MTINSFKRGDFICFIGKNKKFDLQKNLKEKNLAKQILQAVDNICKDYEIEMWTKEIEKIKEI
jgi:hypothetical protein